MAMKNEMVQSTTSNARLARHIRQNLQHPASTKTKCWLYTSIGEVRNSINACIRVAMNLRSPFNKDNKPGRNSNKAAEVDSAGATSERAEHR